MFNRRALGFALAALSLLALSPSAAPAADEKPIKVVICFGPGKKPLTEFGEHLEKNHNCQVSYIEGAHSEPKKGDTTSPDSPFQGIDALEGADVILSNLYRTWAPPDELARLKKAFTTKPVVGLRKAHHGFQNWRAADQQVFGADYHGHFSGKKLTQKIVPAEKDNPLLAGLDVSVLPGGGLYRHTDLQPEVRVLIVGGPEGKEPLPQTFSRIHPKTGQRTLYTRYDHDDISKHPHVRDFVVRAMYWALDRQPAAAANQ